MSMSKLNPDPSRRIVPLLALLLLPAGLFLSGLFGACGPTPTSETTPETTSETTADSGAEPTAEKATEPAPEPSTEPAPEPSTEPTPEPRQEPIADGGEPTPEQTPETPQEITPEQGNKVPVAYILNTDFQKGSLSLVTLSPLALRKEWTQVASAGDLDGDVSLRLAQGYLFVIDRGRSTIHVLEPSKGYTKRATLTLPQNSNPHDVAVVGTRLYVTLYDKAEIMVYEENQPPQTIDLSSLAETSAKACTKDDDCTKFGAGSKQCDTAKGVCVSDGIPELDSLLVVGSKLYVAVQGLDRNDGYKPVKSVVAVIDTTTNKLTGTMPLHGTNPVGFVPTPSGAFYIPQTGSTLATDDGGLELFHPTTGKPSGSFAITEKELGGNLAFPGGVVIVSSSLGYALVNDASFNQSLVQFNPTTGKKLKDIVSQKKLGAIALTPSGELLLTDKGSPQGLRVFQAQTGVETTTQPLSTSASLPPGLVIFDSVAPAQLP